MARMSLSQAAQSVAGKQPVQPVPLVSEPVYPYAGTRRLSPMPPVPGSNAVRIAPAGTRLSPPPPTPGSNAYRVAPAGTLYNYAGQRDGRAMGVPYGPGAYPVINTHNPTMVVLPPRLDLFSHMQNDYANFYRNMLPFITQMSQRAMQQGAKAARPKGAGGPAKPKARLQQPPSGPMGPFFDDRDSFRLRQPGVRPDYKIGVKPTDRSWWPNPQYNPLVPGAIREPEGYSGGGSSTTPPSNPAGRPQADTSGAYGAAGFGVTEPTPLLQEGTFRNRWTWVDPGSVESTPLLPEGTFPNRWTQGALPGEPLNVRQFQNILKGK